MTPTIVSLSGSRVERALGPALFLCGESPAVLVLGEATDHVLTLTGNRISLDFAEGDPNTFTLSGTCYGSVSAA